jgi:hypothetical protein
MTVGAGIGVADGKLVVLGKPVLRDVHENIVVTPASGGALVNGAFIGVRSDQTGSRRVFPIGKLEYVSLWSFTLLNEMKKNGSFGFCLWTLLLFCWIFVMFILVLVRWEHFNVWGFTSIITSFSFFWAKNFWLSYLLFFFVFLAPRRRINLQYYRFGILSALPCLVRKWELGVVVRSHIYDIK